jgi:cytochrome b subunit of formate dehydrogenase
MSVAEGRPAGDSAGVARLATLWLPPLLFLAAIVGIVVVLPSVNRDEGAGTWYRGELGGSDLYRLNVLFARFVPFLAGGSIALALLQRRFLQERESHTAESLQRHTLTEVLIHWLNAAGIGLCLVTAVWLLKWIDNPVSLETSYLIHFIGAGFTVAAVAHHLAYQIVGGGSGLIPRSRADLRSALAEVASYTGVYRGLRGAFNVQLPPALRRPLQSVLRRYNIVPDPAGKYLATEKVISYPGWAILVGIVLVTGLVKSLHYIFSLPGWLRDFATFLHDGATIFLLVFLALHVGALVLVPRNWALLKSMFTTRVPRSYAQEKLPLWAAATEDAPGGPPRPSAGQDRESPILKSGSRSPGDGLANRTDH